MPLKTEYEHIYFLHEGFSLDNHTPRFLCKSKSGKILGRIEWNEYRKQYAYFELGKGIYLQTSLAALADFVGQVNERYPPDWAIKRWVQESDKNAANNG